MFSCLLLYPFNQAVADRIHGHGYADLQLASEAAVYKETNWANAIIGELCKL